MFQLSAIEICNFRSFRGEHKFFFPTEAGLYAVTGVNLDNPRLGPNGVGKSSLLEAIYWCLYGKTTRSLKGGDVVSWGEKSARIRLFLFVGDGKAIIERKQSPNSLTLDGKPVEQDAINKFLRIGPEAFTYAVMLPQFGSSFFDLTPANKLTLFSEIMGLDFWLEKSAYAGEQALKNLTYQIDIDKRLSESDGAIWALESYIKKLGEENESFESQAEEEQLRYEKKLKELTNSVSKYEKMLVTCKKALLGAESRLLKITVEINKGSGKECPTCKQPLPSPDLKRLNQDKKIITQNRDDFAREQRNLENDIFSTKKNIESLKLKISGKKINVFGKLLEEKRKQLNEVKLKRSKLKVELNQLKEDHAALDYWFSGFKRIRLFLVEETLKQLEIEVNNNLMALGLTDWRVEFDVERENKSGGITKGFTVLVYAPNHEQAIRYECWCGGETQRLRLAGDLGLASLIMERAGLRNTFEVFDEPSQHMSQEGLMDLVEALADRAETAGKVILLVDHHSIDHGGFAGTITITKDEKGSRVN